MLNYENGYCSTCGKWGLMIAFTDGSLMCDDCEQYAFMTCDACGRTENFIGERYYKLKDGRLICKKCYAALAIPDDEISDIRDYT